MPTRCPFSVLYHSQEVCMEHLLGAQQGTLSQGPRDGSRQVPPSCPLSPQGLQSSYSEEYLRTLLCQKKLKSR